ncbi:MAG: hypothetical protein ACI3XR_07030 [Eubacteriales bacterium]
MDNRKVVQKSTLYILCWTLILSLLMQSVFLVIGKWNLPVLFGNLLSAAAAVLNFWWYATALAHAAGVEDEKLQRQKVRTSFVLRRVMYVAVAALGLLLPKVFSPFAVIIPLFFPPIAQMFFPLFKNMRD